MTKNSKRVLMVTALFLTLIATIFLLGTKSHAATAGTINVEKMYSKGDGTYGSLEQDGWEIEKKGHDYIFRMKDLTAESISLPYDDADENKDIVESFKPRETSITVEIYGNNTLKAKNIALNGHYVKAITFKGDGNLTITGFQGISMNPEQYVRFETTGTININTNHNCLNIATNLDIIGGKYVLKSNFEAIAMSDTLNMKNTTITAEVTSNNEVIESYSGKLNAEDCVLTLKGGRHNIAANEIYMKGCTIKDDGVGATGTSIYCGTNYKSDSRNVTTSYCKLEKCNINLSGKMKVMQVDANLDIVDTTIVATSNERESATIEARDNVTITGNSKLDITTKGNGIISKREKTGTVSFGPKTDVKIKTMLKAVASGAVDCYGVFGANIVVKNGAQLEIQAANCAFCQKPTFEAGPYYVSTSKYAEGYDAKAKSKEYVRMFHSEARYVKLVYDAGDSEGPTISGDGLYNGKVYCTMPTLTFTDKSGVSFIYVNGEEKYRGGDTTVKISVHPQNKYSKEIIATDLFGNETKMSITVYLDHKTEVVKTNVVKETCTTTGSYTNKYICSRCGKTIKTEKITTPAIGHQFDDWKINGGYKEHSCSICGYVERQQAAEDIAETDVILSTTSYTYDGKAKTPVITVKDANKKLVNGKDYSVKYSNNVDVGTATVTVTGKNDYKGTVKENFTIKKVSDSITASNVNKNYSSLAQSFSIGAKHTGDGKLTYKSNNSSVIVDSNGKVTIKAGFAGSATITITSAETSKYTKATKNITVTVKKGTDSITASNITKAYSAQEQSFLVVAKHTSNGKLSYRSNNSSVKVDASGRVTLKAGFNGKATITITSSATSQFNSATKQITITVTKPVQKAVNNTITAGNFTKTYSTKAQSFSIGAKQKGNGTLTYKSNNSAVKVDAKGKVTINAKFIGKATITITSSATSAYNKATKTIIITVNPPKINLSKLTNSKGLKMVIKWAKNTACTGYQIQYSTNKNFKSGVKTATVKNGSTASTTVKKLAKNKTYYVRIRGYKTVSGTTLYSAWSGVKSIKIKK